MTSANWRIQHVLGHHKGDDSDYTFRALDWTLERYTLKGALLYSFGNTAITFWAPLVESFRKGILQNRRIPINYRAAFWEQIGFIAFLSAMAAWQPVLTFAFLIPWYFLIFAMTRYVDYLNHYGCSEEGLDFANNCLNPAFNWRLNNFGYHTVHHINPTAHWSSLPELHAEIAKDIPPERLKPFHWSSAFLPYHAWWEHRARRSMSHRSPAERNSIQK